jgi:hypothetical protein
VNFLLVRSLAAVVKDHDIRPSKEVLNVRLDRVLQDFDKLVKSYLLILTRSVERECIVNRGIDVNERQVSPEFPLEKLKRLHVSETIYQMRRVLGALDALENSFREKLWTSRALNKSVCESLNFITTDLLYRYPKKLLHKLPGAYERIPKISMQDC